MVPGLTARGENLTVSAKIISDILRTFYVYKCLFYDMIDSVQKCHAKCDRIITMYIYYGNVNTHFTKYIYTCNIYKHFRIVNVLCF